MAGRKVAVLVLKAPDGGVVAIPDEVLDSFIVTPAGALQKLIDNPRATDWRVVGEAVADYQAPAAPPAPSSQAGQMSGYSPMIGITGYHQPLGPGH